MFALTVPTAPGSIAGILEIFFLFSESLVVDRSHLLLVSGKPGLQKIPLNTLRRSLDYYCIELNSWNFNPHDCHQTSDNTESKRYALVY